MVRTAIYCAVAALVAVTAGCRMCAHPYDYCDPPFAGGCGPCCPHGARAGSILSPDAMAAPQMIPEQPETVSDGVAASPDGAPQQAAGDADLSPAPHQDTGRMPLPPNRWIARPAPSVR